MPVTWRREDYGYAAAAAAAITLLLYLVFGNFGLVPSPFAPAALGDESFPVAAVTVPSVDPPTVRPVDAPVTVPRAPGVVVGAAEGFDHAKPAAQITTEPGTSFAVSAAATVVGTAVDTGSGLKEVLVSFITDSGSKQTVTADLTCQNGRRALCNWSAEIPATVADYTISALAVDEAGNEGASGDVNVAVVNPGGAVEQVGDTVARVPSALTKAVGGLLRGLTGALSP